MNWSQIPNWAGNGGWSHPRPLTSLVGLSLLLSKPCLLFYWTEVNTPWEFQSHPLFQSLPSGGITTLQGTHNFINSTIIQLLRFLRLTFFHLTSKWIKRTAKLSFSKHFVILLPCMSSVWLKLSPIKIPYRFGWSYEDSIIPYTMFNPNEIATLKRLP